MKRDVIFVCVSLLFGVVLALTVFVIFAAVALPAEVDQMLTLTERDGYVLMVKNLGTLAGNANLFAGLMLCAIVVALIPFAFVLNTNIRKDVFLRGETLLRFISSMVLSLACVFLAGLLAVGFLDMSVGLRLAQSIVFVLLFALLWFFAGEIGWAGDYTAGNLKKRGLQTAVPSLVLGAATGIITLGLMGLFSWAFEKYFILVSEVLDASGWTSYEGFMYLRKGMLFLSTLSFGIFGGVVTALAPRPLGARARGRRMIFPVVVGAVLLATVFLMYRNASVNYDLNKETLTAAAGLESPAPQEWTFLVFRGESEQPKDENEEGEKKGFPLAETWTDKVEASGMMTSDDIVASGENLERLTNYLDRYRQGSVFRYVARDALVKGYMAKWEVEKARELLSQYADNSLLYRLMLLRHLGQVPKSETALAYLRDFTDETRWSYGRKHSLQLAQALTRFGLLDEARAWQQKALELGADVSELNIPEFSVPMNGAIKGRMLVNGAPPEKPGEVALLSLSECTDRVGDVTPTGFSMRVVDVRDMDSRGEFSFQNLGNGAYYLTARLDPSVAKPDAIVDIKDSPGVICLEDGEGEKDLGNIQVTTR